MINSIKNPGFTICANAVLTIVGEAGGQFYNQSFKDCRDFEAESKKVFLRIQAALVKKIGDGCHIEIEDSDNYTVLINFLKGPRKVGYGSINRIHIDTH